MIFNVDPKIVFIIITQIVQTLKMEEDALHISEDVHSVLISLQRKNALIQTNALGKVDVEIYCIIYHHLDVPI